MNKKLFLLILLLPLEVIATDLAGEVEYISYGINKLDNGICIWDRTRNTKLTISKSLNKITAYVENSTTDTIVTDVNGKCTKTKTGSRNWEIPITITDNTFYGQFTLEENGEKRTTTLSGTIINDFWSGTHNFTSNWYSAKGSPGSTDVSGSFTLTLRNNSTTTQVQSTTGTSFSITPTDADVLTISGTIPDIGALVTLENSNTTIQRADGSTLDINQKAVVTLNPESVTLIRGEVTATLACNYEVRTALATITSCPTTKKGADAAKFTTNYSQGGLGDTSTVDDILTVTVETGSVDIVDRSGVTHTVTAGNEKTIIGRVPRTQWVLPIDEDKLYGGKDNFLIWTQFPNAASYQMEFNLPTPDFAEQNTSVPQFTKQVVPLPAGSYAEFEGLALLTLPLPKGADGLVLELRIFALDATGKIIGESVSSDSTKATVTD